MVPGEPAGAARCEVTRSNPRLQNIHRGHCRSLDITARSALPAKDLHQQRDDQCVEQELADHERIQSPVG